MRLKFNKMHGLGNDFVVIDGIRQTVALTAEQLRFLADRHLGIGCDQILLVERPQGLGDFRYRIFNSDGSEVEQCGNGARCFVRFVVDEGLTDKDEIRVETRGGLITLTLDAGGEVTVNMGVPRFDPKVIPFVAEDDALVHPLHVAGAVREISVLSMGNPHAVQFVDHVSLAPVESEGPLIESHPRFPARVNVGYAEVVSRGEVRLRVYERGAGETQACGSGACAAVVAGIRRGLLDQDVIVRMAGGSLHIRWEGGNKPVFMTGPAVRVFSGEIDL